jgi:RND family efflux transporter MFP subunit
MSIFLWVTFMLTRVGLGAASMVIGMWLFSAHHCFADTVAPGVDGITKPFADLELSFVQPGSISAIFVAEGDLVKSSDQLLKQNDEIELIQKKILTARTENRVPSNLAEKELQQKRKDLWQIKEAEKKGAVTKWEVDHAALAVDTALLTLKIREFERRQDGLQLESLNKSIENLTLQSPLDGRVEEIRVAVGETVQALAPVIRIIDIDPLHIKLATPMEQARKLNPGQQVLVRYPDGQERDGDIINISGVADAAATTLEITIEIPNPEARPAGERVTVFYDQL